MHYNVIFIIKFVATIKVVERIDSGFLSMALQQNIERKKNTLKNFE